MSHIESHIELPLPSAPMEPSADLRTMANFWRQTFVALTLEGFTEAQALTIVGTYIAVSWSSTGG